MMTLWDWHKFGYKTIFRDRFIYLFRPSLEVGYFTEAQGARWMEYENPNCNPWHFINYCQHPELVEEFRNVAANCSCEESVLCNSCAGTTSMTGTKVKSA